MCTRAVCALAFYLERQGIATVVIGLIPQHVDAMGPPRALNVPFALGRPLGAPNEPEFQRRVLTAALDLLTRDPPGPCAEEFTEDAPAAVAEEAWACPVSFPAPPSDPSELAALLTEVRLLLPWFERAREQRGVTRTGSSGLEIEAVCELLGALAAGETPPSSGELSLADQFKLAVEDLKMFYLEAVTAQPNPGSVEEIQTWFWNDTTAGALLKALKERLAERDDQALRIYARFTLVPGGH